MYISLFDSIYLRSDHLTRTDPIHWSRKTTENPFQTGWNEDRWNETIGCTNQLDQIDWNENGTGSIKNRWLYKLNLYEMIYSEYNSEICFYFFIEVLLDL